MVPISGYFFKEGFTLIGRPFLPVLSRKRAASSRSDAAPGKAALAPALHFGSGSLEAELPRR
jgi:hypothetical protein